MNLTYTPLRHFLQEKKQLIDSLLLKAIDSLEASETLTEAIRYSLNAGGKRLRPILLLATLEAFNEKEEMGYSIACALEMVHTYSLIHDDLPAMDDDDMRRGKPTNHKVFGEANAILAGDALLTYSFEMIASVSHASVTNDVKIDIIRRFARAAGPEGMVAGQALDLQAENTPDITVRQLEGIHYRKTGKLLSFAVIAGAVLAGASASQMGDLEQFAFHLGMAFQIRDDILDIEGDEKQTGKPVGSDVKKQKSTYPHLLTLAGAKEKLLHHTEKAKEHLYKANIRHERLEEMVMYIARRDN